MRYQHVVGDVRLHPGGVVEGWCWAPARPRARLRFDVLADDRIIASGEAPLSRPDLSLHGMSDTQHGFRLTLPAGAMDRRSVVLLSVRERRSGVVFGRGLIEPDEPRAAEPGPLAAAAALGLLSERLAARSPGARPVSGRLRAAFTELGTVLPVRAARHGAGVAAARRLLATAGPVCLARPAMPRATLVIGGNTPVASILARLRALAPATHAIGAEIILVDRGCDARVALLPSLVPGLSLLSAPGVADAGMLALAALWARGEWLVLLDATAAGASLASLLARLDRQGIVLATVPRAGTEQLPRLPMAARSGVTLAVRRSVVRDADTAASLVVRLARDGTACAVLDEPWPAPAAR